MIIIIIITIIVIIVIIIIMITIIIIIIISSSSSSSSSSSRPRSARVFFEDGRLHAEVGVTSISALQLKTSLGTSKSVRDWRNTVELVQSEISNSVKPYPSYPSAFQAYTDKPRPAIGFFEPRDLDEFLVFLLLFLLSCCGLVGGNTQEFVIW